MITFKKALWIAACGVWAGLAIIAAATHADAAPRRHAPHAVWGLMADIPTDETGMLLNRFEVDGFASLGECERAAARVQRVEIMPAIWIDRAAVVAFYCEAH